jgi:hypothetical protein
MTNKKLTEMAEREGYQETKNFKFDNNGQKVFEKNGRQITFDKTGHSGGFWKVFNAKTGERLGTFLKDLTTFIGK